MVGAGVRLRYTEGDQRAKERRGRGVQSECTATGGRRFGGFGVKPSPTWESGKLRRLLRKAPRWTGSWASNAHGHTGLNGLGPQNHRHLIWAGRGLDKIEDIKDSDGAWRTSRGCVGSKQPLEATGAVG